jgi:uncharacterized protein YrrD
MHQFLNVIDIIEQNQTNQIIFFLINKRNIIKKRNQVHMKYTRKASKR